MLNKIKRCVQNPYASFLKLQEALEKKKARFVSRGVRRQDGNLLINPVVWIRTPKCASKSIAEYLGAVDRIINLAKYPDLDVNAHDTEAKIICISSGQRQLFKDKWPSLWESSFKWAVVRNPYDRVVSAWKYLEKTKDSPLVDVLTNPPEYDTQPREYHHLTESLFSMVSESGALVIDEVVRFEELESDLANLFAKLGMPFVGLTKINKTPSRKKEDSFLCPQECRLIERLHLEDFSNFDYEKKHDAVLD